MLYGYFRFKRLSAAVLAVCAAAAASLFCGRAVSAQAAGETVPGGGEGAVLPVVMYHSMLREQKRQGKYVVSPDTFERDLQYLKSRGYTTVTVADLVSHVDAGTPLPEKPVMLTFDDGYYNNYLYAFPLAQKYGAKLVIAPVGFYTDLYTAGDAGHANYSHLTWPEISEMAASGLVEFQNHSYRLHSLGARRGASRKSGESAADYEQVLRKDVGKMQDEMAANAGLRPLAFVYPYGAASPESDGILKQMGFRATFLCTEKLNRITADPDCLFSLGRFLRPSGIDSEDYFSRRGIT